MRPALILAALALLLCAAGLAFDMSEPSAPEPLTEPVQDALFDGAA